MASIDRGGLRYEIQVLVNGIQELRKFRTELTATLKTTRKVSQEQVLSARRLSTLSIATNKASAAQAKARAETAKALIVEQRLSTERQRTALQAENVAAAEQRLSIERLRTSTQARKAATAEQRLNTERQRTAIQAQNAATAEQRLATERLRTATQVQNAATAEQRLATERQRTALQTVNIENAQARLSATRARAAREGERFAQQQARGAAATKKASAAQSFFGLQLDKTNEKGNRISFTLRRLIGILAVFKAVRVGTSAFASLITTGIEFNSQIEASEIGIAGLLTNIIKTRDQFGNLTNESIGFAKATELARSLVQRLRAESLRTTATFPELLRSLQEGLPSGLAANLDLDQIQKAVVLVSQAASSLNIPQNQLGEELRSLFSGTGAERTTRIAKAFGVTADRLNELVRATKNPAELFALITNGLAGTAEAAKITADTFSGLKARFSDVLGFIASVAGQGLFTELTTKLRAIVNASKEDFADSFIANPKAVAAVEPLFDGIRDAVRSISTELGKLNFVSIFEATSAIGEGIRVVGVIFGIVLRGIIEGLGDLFSIGKAVFGILSSLFEMSGIETENIINKTLRWATVLIVLQTIFGAILGTLKLFVPSLRVLIALSLPLKFIWLGIVSILRTVFGSLIAQGSALRTIQALVGKIGLKIALFAARFVLLPALVVALFAVVFKKILEGVTGIEISWEAFFKLIKSAAIGLGDVLKKAFILIFTGLIQTIRRTFDDVLAFLLRGTANLVDKLRKATKRFTPKAISNALNAGVQNLNAGAVFFEKGSREADNKIVNAQLDLDLARIALNKSLNGILDREKEKNERLKKENERLKKEGKPPLSGDDLSTFLGEKIKKGLTSLGLGNLIFDEPNDTEDAATAAADKVAKALRDALGGINTSNLKGATGGGGSRSSQQDITAITTNKERLISLEAELQALEQTGSDARATKQAAELRILKNRRQVLLDTRKELKELSSVRPLSLSELSPGQQSTLTDLNNRIALLQRADSKTGTALVAEDIRLLKEQRQALLDSRVEIEKLSSAEQFNLSKLSSVDQATVKSLIDQITFFKRADKGTDTPFFSEDIRILENKLQELLGTKTELEKLVSESATSFSELSPVDQSRLAVLNAEIALLEKRKKIESGSGLSEQDIKAIADAKEQLITLEAELRAVEQTDSDASITRLSAELLILKNRRQALLDTRKELEQLSTVPQSSLSELSPVDQSRLAVLNAEIALLEKRKQLESPGNSSGLSEEDIRTITMAKEEQIRLDAELQGLEQRGSVARATALDAELLILKNRRQAILDTKTSVEDLTEAQKELLAVLNLEIEIVQKRRGLEARGGSGGIEEGLNRFIDSAGPFKAAATLTEGALNDFSDALAKALEAPEDAGQILLDFFRNLVSQIIKELVRLAVAEALISLGFGEISGASDGGAITAGGVRSLPAKGAAAGGKIEGGIPHGVVRPKGLHPSDTIPIWAAHNEFMQPVAAVKKYGLAFMEMIRSGSLPVETVRSLTKGVRLPRTRQGLGRGFAEGGSITSSRSASPTISSVLIFSEQIVNDGLNTDTIRAISPGIKEPRTLAEIKRR